MQSLSQIDLHVFIGLLLAAACAGWIDAVAGGGGLIQLPALLLGLGAQPPATILGTNKLSSVIGTSAATATYLRRRDARPDFRSASSMAASAFVGSMAGASLATRVPANVFRPLVLVLLVLVGAWTLLRPQLGHTEKLRWTSGPTHLVIISLAGIVIGFYDGIFGPGTGSFLVFILVGVIGYSFLRASATAKIVNLGTNIAALVVFVPAHHVLVPLGLAMGSCNLLGGVIGAHMASLRGSEFVRKAFLVVVAIMIAKLGWDQFR